MSVLSRVAAAVAAAAVLAACTAGAGGSSSDDGETIMLRYAFFAPAESFPGLQMERWKEEIEERTDGRVEVELYPGATLLGSGDIYDGVRAGTADVGLDSPAYDTTRFPVSSAIQAPIGVENAEVASAAFLDLLEELEPREFADYEIITAFTTEPAYFQTKAEVTTMADLSGMELRSSSATIPALARLGATGIGMPMPDVAESLQTGVIDGYVSSREVMQDFGLAEHVGYVTDYPLGPSNSFVAVMDKGRYDELPEEVQTVIQELKPEMSQWASDYHDNENVTAALDFAEDQGVQMVEVDESERAQWDALMEEVADDWAASHENADIDAPAVLERLRELVAEHAESE